MSNEFQRVIDQITPDIYENMKKAVETGRWPDGRQVTNEQRATCMQTVIAWEAKNLPEHERTGYMEQHCKSQAEDEQPVTLRGDLQGEADSNKDDADA